MGLKFPGTPVCRSTSVRRHKDLRYTIYYKLLYAVLPWREE